MSEGEHPWIVWSTRPSKLEERELFEKWGDDLHGGGFAWWEPIGCIAAVFAVFSVVLALVIVPVLWFSGVPLLTGIKWGCIGGMIGAAGYLLINWCLNVRESRRRPAPDTSTATEVLLRPSGWLGITDPESPERKPSRWANPWEFYEARSFEHVAIFETGRDTKGLLLPHSAGITTASVVGTAPSRVVRVTWLDHVVVRVAYEGPWDGAVDEVAWRDMPPSTILFELRPKRTSLGRPVLGGAEASN